MKTKPPPHRRKFANEGDEIEYLYDKLLYWLHVRHEADKARPYAERLAKVLPKADPKNKAILGQECWSLVYEVRGNQPAAIKHREKEIDLIRQLHSFCKNAP